MGMTPEERREAQGLMIEIFSYAKRLRISVRVKEPIEAVRKLRDDLKKRVDELPKLN